MLKQMANSIVEGGKRFLLWEFSRGSWQYDVMVGAVLVFVFLTPREWFRDQPRMINPSSIVKLPAERGTESYWLDQALLPAGSEGQITAKAADVLAARIGRKPVVLHVQAIRDEAENELKGYLVLTRP